MSAKTLNWGVLSTARINRALIPPLQASKRNKLVAVASRSQARAEEYARQWNIPGAYGSYEEMLADPDIDVIYNPLPNSLHAEWTIRAVEAGKHVLCEKPLAISTAEVDAVITAAKAHRQIVAEAFMYRHHPQTMKVKEMVEGGAIGELRLVRGAFTFNINRPGDVRLDPQLGGGSIWDVGCYPLSYTRCVIGREPQEVFGWQVTGNSGVDEVFTAQMRFPGDILAQFDCGFRSDFRAQMEFVGSLGTIIVPSPFKPDANEKILLRRGDEEQSIRMHGPKLLYSGEVEDMADAVLLGKPQHIPLADSRANVAAIQALLQSAKEGKPVRLGS
jgi:D-xylose 1-dehydrogenase (NADP+, D-xylono-1,5-lactone-forming)